MGVSTDTLERWRADSLIRTLGGVFSSGAAEAECLDHHLRHGRIQPQRLVPRERRVSARAQGLTLECDVGPG